jgi:hypothetical protein
VWFEAFGAVPDHRHYMGTSLRSEAAVVGGVHFLVIVQVLDDVLKRQSLSNVACYEAFPKAQHM